MQLLPRICAREAPFDFGLRRIARFFQLLDFTLERFFIANPSVQTLTTENAQFNLRDIQPTAMLWRIVKLQLPEYAPRLFRRECLIQRRRAMRVQVIQHHSYPLRRREGFVSQPFHLSGEVLHRSLLGHRDVPPATLRFAHHKQVAYAASLILIIKTLDFPGPGGKWLSSFSNQLFTKTVLNAPPLAAICYP